MGRPDAHDLSWNRLVYDLTPSQLGLAMNSMVTMLPTPDNLARWRCREFSCKLCGALKPTPAHLLSSCPAALLQGRYTYRHNQVLTVLHDAVVRKVHAIKPRRVHDAEDDDVRFHAAGVRPPPARKPKRSGLLDSASERISCDLPALQPYIFPIPAITEKRPDVVLCSEATKQLIILELTVPNENNVAAALQRKTQSYKDLVDDCCRTHRTTFRTVEISTRGFVHVETQRTLLDLGISSDKLHRALSNAALRGSYAIYIHRNERHWSWDVNMHGVTSTSVP